MGSRRLLTTPYGPALRQAATGVGKKVIHTLVKEGKFLAKCPKCTLLLLPYELPTSSNNNINGTDV